MRIHINEDGSHWSEIDWDCFKLRGGIIYGKVFVVDQAAKDKGILLNTNGEIWSRIFEGDAQKRKKVLSGVSGTNFPNAVYGIRRTKIPNTVWEIEKRKTV